MRAYAVEGLDCSGKKTIANIVQKRLGELGVDATIVIGPLVGGRLGQLDARLSNIVVPVRRTGLTDISRRTLYVAEPMIDRIAAANSRAALKISTHFRAWARAEVEHDQWMIRAYSATAPVHVRYAGAALLATDFSTRLRRHNADYLAGRTTKIAERRFLGPDRQAFACWHQHLDRLMARHVSRLLRLDSSEPEPSQLAENVVHHALACWNIEP
ncbi:MAG TPA: hypothetical protein VN767_12630 [Streptosporangiaceae bacterium]|jgi:hypothetical protein|nr:hypothetical protein [Streptosporangiaceae bacterium]